LDWTLLSRHRIRAGRKCVGKELRGLIFRMVAENSTWGAPRIHGELKMLGFDLSERTVLRWMRKAPRSPEPAKRWSAFLSNHREAIAAMDFFTVPTLTFGVLYCFFVITHDRQRILHWNVTKHPSSTWVVQQLREAFPYDSAPRLSLIHIYKGKLIFHIAVQNHRAEHTPTTNHWASSFSIGGWRALSPGRNSFHFAAAVPRQNTDLPPNQIYR